MAYTVKLTKLAQDQFDLVMTSYPKSDRSKLLRIITDDLVNHPRYGIGKPEYQKGNHKWTRRLTDKDRIQYYIHDKIVEVEVIKCLGHNDDK